ncbi:MAG: hypothetical protein LKE40_10600 [Spirochaetia bacterium]|jgi:hypothetical protein|nr:hypothetical protein [Spirochaetia bacterium]
MGMRALRTGFVLVGSLLLTSCATVWQSDHTQQFFESGDYAMALVSYQDTKDRVVSSYGKLVYSLDEGSLAHAAGSWDVSNEAFSTAQDEIETNYTRSISGDIASYLVTDATRTYDGYDWENVFLNIFMGLNYYGKGETDEALVEMRRAIEKQTYLQQKYPQMESNMVSEAKDSNLPQVRKYTNYHFVSSRLTQYLSLLFSYEGKDYDTFDYALGQLHFNVGGKNSFPYYLKGLPDRPEEDVSMLNIVAFSGLAPVLGQTTIRYKIQDGHYDSKHVWHPAKYASSNFADIRKRGSAVTEVEVLVDGQPVKVPLFEDIEGIALSSLEPAVDAQNLRIVARKIIRTVGNSLAEDRDDNLGNWLSFGFQLLDLTDHADLRCSHYFPAAAYVASVPVTPGKHEVCINYYTGNGHLGYTRTYHDVVVTSGKANLIEVLSSL